MITPPSDDKWVTKIRNWSPFATPYGQPDSQLLYQSAVFLRPRIAEKNQHRSAELSQARENTAALTDPASPVRIRSMPAKESDSNWTYHSLSIAAGTIVAIVAFAALVFLLVWYIRREQRAKRLRGLPNQSQNISMQSSLSLTEDTSKTLDSFLMKNVKPERTSLMFSSSRSPSVQFVVDQASRSDASKRFYRNSYDASTNSLTKLDSLTRVSTSGTRSSPMVSELTQTATNSSQQPSSSVQATASGTPRLSTSSTAPPTARSSQLWTTTTGTTVTTELSSLFSRDAPSSRTSNSVSVSLGANLSPGSGTPQLTSQPSNASRTSSHEHGSTQSPTQLPNDSEGSQKAQISSQKNGHSEVISLVTESPLPRDSAQSPQLPAILSTPSSPFFKVSED